MTGRTRRDLLRAGIGAATVATLGGAAGCLGSGGNLGGGDGGDGTPWYADWLPARELLSMDADTSYGFVTVEADAIRENGDAFSSGTFETLRSSLGGQDGVLPAFETVDRVVSAGGGGADSTLMMSGSFDADGVAEGLLENQYGREPDYSGYEVYAREEGGAFGVADGSLVVAYALARPVESLQALIDVREGDGPRLVDGEDAAELVEFLGEGTFANGAIPGGGVPLSLQSDALAANGLRGRISGENTDLRQVLVYDGPEDADADAVEEASATAGALDGASVSTDGRTALVEGSVPTGDLAARTVFARSMADPGLGGETATPSATFEYDYDEGAGTVEIVHNGGDTFQEENTSALRYGLQGGSLREWPLPVSAGDGVTFEGEFESGETVVVVWESPEGGRTATVGEYRIP